MSRLILSGPSRSGTTISSRFLSHHKDIWITNEVRIYMSCWKKDQISFMYENLRKNIKYFNLPPGVDINKFKDKQIDKVKPRIEFIENVLFNNKYKFFGDKGIFKDGAKVLYNNDIDYKLIIIYRDGRDVLSSVKRRIPKYEKISAFGYGPGDLTKISEDWYKSFCDMRDLAKDFNIDHVIIKFEDYVNSPGKNSSIIEGFLGVGGLSEIESNIIEKSKSNIGNYKKNFMDWERVMHSDAIKLNTQLGYTEG